MTMLKMTEGELHQMGFQVTGNEIVRTDGKPDESWDLDRLTTYLKRELANSQKAEEESLLQSHKSAIHLFKAGRALAIAREKCKADGRGAWVKWQEDQKLARTTVYDAIRLYEEAETEDALVGLGITEAKKKFVYPEKEEGEPGSEKVILPVQGRRNSRSPQRGECQPEKPIEEDKPDLLADLAGIENVLANWTTGLPDLADQDRQIAVETVASIKKHLEEIFNAAA